MSDFERCLKFSLSWEGGYSDHPADRGGSTNFGITQRTYNTWLKQQDRPPRPVIGITSEEVSTIYRIRYWNLIQGEKLPIYVNMAVLDFAIHSGPGRAARALQKVVGVSADGKIGPITLEAAFDGNPFSTAGDVNILREQFARQIVDRNPTQAVFLKGWLNRIRALRDAIRLWRVEDLTRG